MTKEEKIPFLKKVLSENFSISLLYIGFGLLVLSIVIFYCQDLFTDFGMLGADHIAQFGDAIGGVIGSIWALAGVILFYVALRDQRKDFEINKDALITQNDSIKLQTDALISQNKSIELQLKEISLQTEAQKQTQEELENQKKEFQIQNKTLRIQRFENTFFQLLGIHHDIVENMESIVYEGKGGALSTSKNNYYKDSKSIIKGRAVFKTYCGLYLADQFIQYFREENHYQHENGEVRTQVTYYSKELLTNTKDNFDNPTVTNIKENISFRYGDVYHNIQSNLGHYYRNLYRVFKFIDYKEFINFDEVKQHKDYKNFSLQEQKELHLLINNTIKYQYSSMVRAQLSDYELWWLTFNCLWAEGVKFWHFVEKFSLLKNHPDKEFMENLVKLSLYTKSSIDKSWNENIYNFQLYDELIKKDNSILSKGDIEYIATGKLIKNFIN